MNEYDEDPQEGENRMGERIAGWLGSAVRAHPTLAACAAVVLGLICWRYRDVTDKTMEVIAAVTAAAAATGVAAAVTVIALRWKRYLRDRRNGPAPEAGPVPEPETGPDPADWAAWQAQIEGTDQEYRR